MTDRELENRLRTALDHAAPNDLSGVLSRCKARKGTVIHMTNAMENHHFNNHTNQPAGKKRRSRPKLVVAACLALVIAGGAVYFGQQGSALASVVCLDVNPSIELRVSEKEKVLSATAMNDDAVEILDGMDLDGTDVGVAANAIIGSLLQHGYVDELANSILITVEDDDLQRGEALKQALTEQASAALAGAQLNGAILAQTLQFSDELSRKAEEYGVSAGKAALIQAVVTGSSNTKTFEDLVGLSINELNLIYTAQTSVAQTSGEAGTGSGTIVSSGNASQSAYIGQQAAQETALKHAGLTAAQVTFLESEYDYDDGRMIYEVEFHYSGTEYDYEIDALTGELIKYHKEANGNGGGTSGGSTDIGSDKAKSIALNHAGVSGSQTRKLEVKRDFDDGRLEYEVKFQAAGTEYEYTIDAATGTILDYDIDR